MQAFASAFAQRAQQTAFRRMVHLIRGAVHAGDASKTQRSAVVRSFACVSRLNFEDATQTMHDETCLRQTL